MSQQVEFFFDPICPFCWQTSKWFRQVAQQVEITPVWRFIALAILNEDDPNDSHGVGLELLRVAAEVKARDGMEAVGPYYEAVGTRLWEVVPGGADPTLDDDAKWKLIAEHQRAVVDDLPAILESVGLPAERADARSDQSHDVELRASTDEAMARTGGNVGTPILSFDPPDGPAFFGPVISSTPSDEQAVELWDAVVTLSKWPSFAELKRSLREPIDNATLAAFED